MSLKMGQVLIFAVLSIFCYALQNVLSKIYLGRITPIFLQVGIYLIAFLIALLLLILNWQSLKNEYMGIDKFPVLLFIVILSILIFLGDYAFFRAYYHPKSTVGLVSSIIATFPIWSMLLYSFYSKRLPSIQEIFGVVLVILGVIITVAKK